MHRHPRWKHLGQVGNYALCIIDELNYGIYDVSKPSGFKHTVRYFGTLGQALRRLLEWLIRDEASRAVINDIADAVEVVEAEADRVVAFGRELDAKFSRKDILEKWRGFEYQASNIMEEVKYERPRSKMEWLYRTYYV